MLIIRINLNTRQAAAAPERPVADARNAVGYDYVSQAGAATECTIADARNAVGYGNVSQVG